MPAVVKCAERLILMCYIEGGRENGKNGQIMSRNHRGGGHVTTEPFGPLKTVLESASAVYARYEVS